MGEETETETMEEETERMQRDVGDAKQYVIGAEFKAAEQACNDAVDDLEKARTVTMESWWVIGDFLQKCRYAALALAGTNNTQDPRYKRKFGGLVDKTKARNIDAVTRSKLLDLVDHKQEVMEWYEDLEPKQQARWLHPTTIWAKFKAAKRPQTDRPIKKAGPKEKAVHEPSSPAELADAIHRPLNHIEIGTDVDKNVERILGALETLGLSDETFNQVVGGMSTGLFGAKKFPPRGKGRGRKGGGQR